MSVSRLLSLQAQNDAAGAEMAIESARFDRIKGVKPVAVSSFNMFQTPETVAARMAEALPGDFFPLTVLEPSAGLGRLYRASLRRFPEARYTLVENSPACAAHLWNLPVEFMQRDFLTVSSREFDLIIMNPPFKQGTDIKHIKHAAEILAPGGILISLCYNGVRQNEILKPLTDTWEVLPENSFRESGTGASVAMITIHRKDLA